jgi:hypothetical protein
VRSPAMPRRCANSQSVPASTKEITGLLPVKRHRGEPGHTRDTQDTRAQTGTRITPQTNLTTIQTQRHTRTTTRRPHARCHMATAETAYCSQSQVQDKFKSIRDTHKTHGTQTNLTTKPRLSDGRALDQATWSPRPRCRANPAADSDCQISEVAPCKVQTRTLSGTLPLPERLPASAQRRSAI